MQSLNSLTEHDIHHKISIGLPKSYDVPSRYQHASNKQASVLIPFIRKGDAWHILFIRRAMSPKDRHSGQVAFVGGKREDTDTSEIDTALRETQEEIGLDASHITVLGRLGLHYSISQFEITPIVAVITLPETPLQLDPAEVSHTFTLPLDWLADDNNIEIKQRQAPEIDEPIPVVYFKKYEGELLWGATAKMVLSLLTALKK